MGLLSEPAIEREPRYRLYSGVTFEVLNLFDKLISPSIYECFLTDGGG